ncbi:MAG: RrF2 family transcriptional regulator [Bdellovibrionia bacterium]
MILRNQVEWAIHCCSILAALPQDHYLATKDLAEFHGVPKEYLSKALQALSQAGIVHTTLGPRGGYRLAKSLKEISFLDIVEAIEGRRSTFECTEIRKNSPCRSAKTRDTGPCAIARVMYRADQAWRNELSKMTLLDLQRELVHDLPKELLEQVGGWVKSRCGGS